MAEQLSSKEKDIFFPINVWTAATTTTQHVYNIKHQVKYRHRQNDIYSETLLKSHSFSLLIPSWKCFPALEANSSLFKHNLIQPPTNCFLSSLAEQESSVLVFTCSGEQTAQPGLVCVYEFLGCLLLESTCNTCLSVMMFFAPWPTCPSFGWHVAGPLLFWFLSPFPSSPYGARPAGWHWQRFCCWPLALDGKDVRLLSQCQLQGWCEGILAMCRGLLLPHLLPIHLSSTSYN